MSSLAPESLLSALNWRYATKRFDPSKKVPEPTWRALEQALTLSPSSFGIQPWKFVVVTDPAIRAKLRAVSWNQPQIEDCSHLVVFAMKKGLGAQDVDHYIQRIAEVRKQSAESLEDFRKMMVGFIKARSSEQVETWVSRQIYIALGTLLTSAALLGLDACPMEGLDGDKYDEILGLKDHHVLCVAAVGYRHPDDDYAKLAKVRFPQDEVIAHS